MCVEFSSSDGRDDRVDHDDRNGHSDGHGDRDDGDDLQRPVRILWLSNAMVYALELVYDVQFLLGLYYRQVLWLLIVCEEINA